MAKAVETRVCVGVLSYDRTLPRSWFELIDENTNIRYYWNSITNATQYERPNFSLEPIHPPLAPTPTTCPTCRFNIQHSSIVSGQSSSYSNKIHMDEQYRPALSFGLKMHQPANLVQSSDNTNALVPHQLDTRGVACTPILNVTSGVGLGSALHHMYSPSPVAVPDATSIFPFGRARVDSSLTNSNNNVPFKDSLYISLEPRNEKLRWYHLDLSGGSATDVLKKEFILAGLLDEEIQRKLGTTFAVLNSSIYCIDLAPTTPRRSESSSSDYQSEVLVLDIEHGVGFGPIWKKFPPLVKPRNEPCAVSMGGKIYVFGAESKTDNYDLRPGRDKLNEIEVLIRGPKSSKWETLPFNSPPEISDWSRFFVVAFDDQNKLVMGTCNKRYVYLYDVNTYQLKKIKIDGLDLFPWSPNHPPVIVGQMLFLYCYGSLFAYDLVKRSHFYAEIDGLSDSFVRDACSRRNNPELVYLGGGKLCLVCLRSGKPSEDKSTVHCCIFYVPEFTEQCGQRLLRGRLHSVHKFDIAYTEYLWHKLVV